VLISTVLLRVNHRLTAIQLNSPLPQKSLGASEQWLDLISSDDIGDDAGILFGVRGF
jgi:hypothetical protein